MLSPDGELVASGGVDGTYGRWLCSAAGRGG